MAQKLNPFSGVPFIDANGDPYSGAQLFVYVAGSSTKQTTTKDLAGASSHANPIILNSNGLIADGAGAAQGSDRDLDPRARTGAIRPGALAAFVFRVEDKGARATR